MLLKWAQVTDFKSINDSTKVEVEGDVTCLVGKNESGKTAFLEALFKLNPLQGPRQKFEELRDYPRVRRNDDKPSIGERCPITAAFELEADDVAEFEKKFGKGCLSSKTIGTRRTYDGKLIIGVPLNESAVVKHLLTSKSIDVQPFAACKTVEDLKTKLGSETEPAEGIAALLKDLKNYNPQQEAATLAGELMPKFLLFDNYSTLPGIFSIPYIQAHKAEQLKADEVTAKCLLQLAGVDAKEFVQAAYEPRRAALEAAMSSITNYAFKYWKQNQQLRVMFDVDFQSPQVNEQQKPPFFQVRIDNLRHYTSLNFNERSHGFIWFFSFLTYFSAYRNESDRLIILLDEPGLSLHAAGQEDLLDMIDKELAPKHQVLYTTHSPFMIRANQLQRARTVEDMDDVGTVVSKDIFRNKRETIFPLQAALGYSMAQTLFVGADNVVVEGPSDLIYLQVMSAHLKEKGRVSLDARWTLVPAGGMDKVPAFIALYGNQLNVAVLLDSEIGAGQRVKQMIDQGLLQQNKLINIGEFTQRNASDIEDLFGEDFYLKLLADSGEASVDKSKLTPGPRINVRIERLLGKKLDHMRPANHFLRNQATLLPQLDAETLDRFESLFKRLQSLLA